MPDKEKVDATGEELPAVKVGRARQTGDLTAVKRIQWLALRTAYRRMKAAKTFDQQGKVIYEVIRSGEAYVKLLEQTDLAAELEALRKELHELRQSEGLKKVA